MTGTIGQPRAGKTAPITASMTAAQQAGFASVAQSSKDDYGHGAPVDPAHLTPGDLAVFGDSAAIVTGPGQLRWADGTPQSVAQAAARSDFKGLFGPCDPADSTPAENPSREKDSASDMVDAITEIGGEMVDQLIDGIREHCASTPNPLLAPERHFFREVASGLVAMSHDDLLTFCAAAITRIAYPHLFAAQ